MTVVFPRFLTSLLLVSFFVASAPASGHAQEYVSGAGPLDIFDGQAMAALPLVMKVWLIALVGTFILGLFFVRRHTIARWAVIGFALAAVTGHVTFAALGLPFLGGSVALWHIVFWAPVLVLLLIRRPFLDAHEGIAFRVWSGVLTVFILISFFFDVQHSMIYIAHVSGW